MRGDEGDPDDDEVIITVPAEMQAGVWANWAAISESDHAFVESCISHWRMESQRGRTADQDPVLQDRRDTFS